MNPQDLEKMNILQSVCESLSDGVVVADSNGKLLIFNPAAEEMVGIGMLDISPEEWSKNYGLYLSDQKKTIYPPEDLPLARAIRGERVQEVEVFVQNNKKQRGVWLSVNARPILEETGKIVGGVAIFRDITERKKYEKLKQDFFNKLEKEFLDRTKTLRETNEKLEKEILEREQAEKKLQNSFSLLQATLDSTADGILVVDENGQIVRYNQKFVEMWQVPESILESKDDQKAIEFVLNQLRDPEGFVKKVRELYDSPDAHSFDILEFKDGKIFERYSQPQRLIGKNVGRVWSFRDVTQQKVAESELQKKTSELARSNKELEQFAYIASHDLQEPLHKIVAFSDLIQESFQGEMSEKLVDYFKRIQRSADRMRHLIDDLLQFARITTRAKPFEEIDLIKIMEEIIGDLEQRILEGRAEINITSLPKIFGDRRQILQLFTNLLSNALKFHRKEESAKIEIGFEKGEPNNVTIWIRDHGLGFDEKYLEKIFQPFQRLHGKNEYDGSGMGLTLCQKIVERHGGKIWAQSGEGKGATFFVKLPC